MCGIIGYCSRKEPIDLLVFNQMRDTMAHRGPDGMDSCFFSNNFVALGHRRLSIIDLSEQGKQPMSTENGQIWITFNGEIYNYQILREELIHKYPFKSQTDTEVVLYGYLEWGMKELLNKLEGMFAFAIYDITKERMFLARDKVGIKPLYYYLSEHAIVFASELKAITAYPKFIKKINPIALASYFKLRYVMAPYTIYENCFKLLPGHFIEFNQFKKSSKLTKYWSIDSVEIKHRSKEKLLIEKIQRALDRAVQSHVLTSDVPVHTFLSGGIDSSTITALAKKYNKNISSYSIEVKDESKNEIDDAKYVADYLNVSLTTDTLDAQLFNKLHNEVVLAYDEPMADTSNIPTYFLCQLTAKHVKVSLSGDGGDELFYGYKWYQKLPKDGTSVSADSYFKTISNTLSNQVFKTLFPNLTKENLLIEERFINKYKEKSISKKNAHKYDFVTFMLDDILTKVDTASMAHSLEARVPFLDYNVITLALSIPEEQLYQNQELKYILKKASEKWLTKKTLYKQKKGFSVPSVSWLKEDVVYNILEGYTSNDKIWSKNGVKKLLKSNIHEEVMWLLYNFERWYAYQFHNSKMALKPSLFYKIKRKLLSAS